MLESLAKWNRRAHAPLTHDYADLFRVEEKGGNEWKPGLAILKSSTGPLPQMDIVQPFVFFIVVASLFCMRLVFSVVRSHGFAIRLRHPDRGIMSSEGR